MSIEPSIKRTVVFIDGQNLFHAVKNAYGYSYPNYDPLCLSKVICSTKGWQLDQVRFYTGRPNNIDDAFWHYFWANKLAVMGSRGIYTFARDLKYRNQTVKLSNGTMTTVLVGQEKGIDIRIALDTVKMARENIYDVALIFSQDQDLSEVADEIRSISKANNRWMKIASAFPISPTYKNTRGINNTDWIQINRQEYDNCIDPYDYRPKTKSQS